MLAGCETTAIAPPQDTRTVALEAATRRATLTVPLGNGLKLELPPPRTAGHAWEIVQNDTRYLHPLAPLRAVEGVGPMTVTFHARRLGRTQLKFLAAPPSGPATAAVADYYDVIVTIE